MQIFVQVEVFVFVGLNWEDAPPDQFAVRGVDYKVTDSFQENMCAYHHLDQNRHFEKI